MLNLRNLMCLVAVTFLGATVLVGCSSPNVSQPATGPEPLGSMGKPLRVTVEGREVFLCCGDCEDQLHKDPATYLAKLKSE
jgi:hypothetical protein